MKILVSLILLLAGAATAARETSEPVFQKMDAAFRSALSCRTDLVTKEPKKLLKSVNCFQSHLSADLSVSQQAALSGWFQEVGSVHRIWSCAGEEYQLESFSSYTPHFVCVELDEGKTKKTIRVIFFEEKNNGFVVSSVYVPMKW